ncbi:MAG: MBL fold metallo-hydrolase [Ruminococcaceae bacterium]|nr:MBL fold metallo-hydrolase [Oscillospiraceae bacterium]
MKLRFLGAAHEVTGSCTLLEVCGKNILIDCGLEQGADTYENCSFPLAPSQIDCVLLTHAHIDHSGKLPYLTANGYKGDIYTTAATEKLCEIMLLDSAHIQESEAIWRNRKARRAGEAEYVPLYTSDDAKKCVSQFVPCRYNEEYTIFDFLKIRFIDAGHLLGSASIEITATENGKTKKLLFSGDVGNIDRPLIRNPEKPTEADLVVIESTYGDRLHGEREDYLTQLKEIINTTVEKGGNVVIPSFAIGRTQELLYLIHILKDENLIDKDLPVYVDSPLSVQATKIYSDDMAGSLIDFYDEETLEYLKKGINILGFERLHLSVTSAESVDINNDASPKVIISSSGMCEAGRIRHHLKHNLWRRECTILFVGYQSVGTLGRIICDGAKRVTIMGEQIAVNANIATIDGISGHADMNMLLDWLSNLNKSPEMVFVNHGGDGVCDSFAEKIVKKLDFPAVAPYNGAYYDLFTMECLEGGNTVKLTKAPSLSRKSVSASYDRLLAAGRRLLAIIERKKYAKSKEQSKLTSQINDLCKKWEK